jgi:uncharacterized protein
MSQSSDLYRIQRIDTQQDQAQARLREIDQILQSDPLLLAAENTLAEAEKDLQSAQKALINAEEAVRSQNIKIEQSEAALYGGKVHNPKELQDLQNEVKSLKKFLLNREDHQIEAMIALEEIEKKYQAAQINLAEVQKNSSAEKAGLRGEREGLVRNLERLASERQAVATTIPEANITLYLRLRQQKRGVAVVQVQDSTCSACGATLTPAEWQTARSPHQLSLCPSCGRILYAG